MHSARWPQPIPAQVPGSIYADLLRAGRGPAPYWRNNQAAARTLLEQGFTYQCLFQPEPALLDCQEILLRFEGVDGLAQIQLNGSPLGETANMHRTCELPVTHLLHPGENRLTVSLQPPGRGYPRKARYAMDGAFGLRLPDGGLWRPVKLLGVEGARIEEVRIRQKHAGGKVELSVGSTLRASAGGVRLQVSLTTPQGKAIPFPAGSSRLTIEDPQLWWPRGYGEQPLYTVKVEAFQAGRSLDLWEGKTGLRTVALDRTGGGLAHVVNGVPVFAMGAGFLPEDCLPANRSRERLRQILEDCAAAHFNCLRVRGEGFYPEDSFYDLCDQLGLLVWQDMMFSGGSFPRSREEIWDLQAEIEDNVKRLRHHPCIGLWCGNAGMEAALEGGAPKLRADYINIFEYVIPETIYQLDPDTPYWPSSPSSGGGFDDPACPEKGDSRIQESFTAGKPPRYASGFGLPSLPCLRTVETFTEPRDRNLHSYIMEAHQPPDGENAASLIQQEFLYPSSLDAALYASQLAQALSARRVVEELRRQRGPCMGALYWQAADCWPGASWSSIDYTGRWKALHYFARRFFAPLLLTCRTAGAAGGAHPPEQGPEKALVMAVSNETTAPRQVTVRWALRDGLGRVKREETISLSVPALACARLDSVPLPEARTFEDFVSGELLENGAWTGLTTALFTRPKYYRFSDPCLSCRAEGDELVVTAKAYAQCVELQNSGEDLVLSDNYFDMLPGERRVKLLRGAPNGLRARSVYDIR